MKIRKPLAAALATATMAALAVTGGVSTASAAIDNASVTVHLDQTGCTQNTNNTDCQITRLPVRPHR